MTTRSLLAIDPGLHLGWAYFPAGKTFPSKAGLIKPRTKGKSFFVRLHTTVTQYAVLLKRFSPDDVAIEWPTIHGTAKGHAAAGSGSVIKLAFTVGKLAQVAEAYGSNFIPVEIIKWKGQLKKPIVIKRLKQILPAKLLRRLLPEDDTWDAIGIGLYMRGLF